MATGKNTGRLVFSIDVAGRGLNAHAVRSIRTILADHGLPATWAVADMNSPTVSELRGCADEQEVALLADRDCFGTGAARSKVYQTLHDRLQQAIAAGVVVSSIATDASEAAEHVDLFAKHGIGAIRTARPRRRGWMLRQHAESPAALRYGVWRIPTTVDVVRDGVRQARAAIRRAVRQHTTVVLVADIESVSPIAIKRLASTAIQLSDSGRLAIETLSAAADSLARRRQMSPAQSILRAA